MNPGDATMFWTSVFILWAVLLQGLEGIRLHPPGRWRGVEALRSLLCLCGLGILLARGGLPPIWFGGIALLTWIALMPFHGLFNGGSDVLTQMVLLALFLPGVSGESPDLGLSWIALLSALSYFFSGLRKAVHPDWWSGEALRLFLKGSRVRVSDLPERLPSGAFRIGASAVILFELGFPLFVWALARNPSWIVLGLGFHLLNFWFFGLNRFFWVWLSTYPALLWFSGISWRMAFMVLIAFTGSSDALAVTLLMEGPVCSVRDDGGDAVKGLQEAAVRE